MNPWAVIENVYIPKITNGNCTISLYFYHLYTTDFRMNNNLRVFFAEY